MIDASNNSKENLEAKYNKEIINFFKNVQDGSNKGVLSHKGVNISEIAFIKKKKVIFIVEKFIKNYKST